MPIWKTLIWGGANLEGANLTGVHLEHTYLEGANLRGTLLPNSTKKPDELGNIIASATAKAKADKTDSPEKSGKNKNDINLG